MANSERRVSLTHSPPRPERAGGSLALLGGVVLLAALASIFLAGVILRIGVTPDFPWLKAAGDWILEHGRLPATDPFSWTAAQRPWVLYQWGFEVALAALDRVAGHSGVAVVVAWAALTVYLIGPLHMAPQRTSACLVAAVAAAVLVILSVNLSIRPMIATSAGLLLQYVLIDRVRDGRAGLRGGCLAALLLYVAWANLHAGFVLGLGSLLLTLAGDWVERRPSDREATAWPAPLPPIQAAALFAAAAAGSLITPYGPALHAYVASLSADTALNGRIDELGAADFGMMQFRLFLALTVILIAALMRRRGTLRPTDLLHLTLLILATVVTARFVVWAALYLVLLLPTAVARAWPGLAACCQSPGDRALVLGLTLVAAVSPPLLALNGVVDPVGPLCARLGAAIDAYVAARRPEDRLLTDPISGSCMIAAAPGLPVFIDTRFDFYGGTFSERTLDALALKPGWRELLDAYGIDVAILDRARPLAEALIVDPQFATLYRDDEAVVVRRLHKRIERPY